MTTFPALGDDTPDSEQPTVDVTPDAPEAGDDPAVLAQAVDAVIDEAQEALASGDAASASALLTAAEATSDALLEVLGVPDVDDTAGE